jgi:ABC-type phosphate transport system substrate-binding protein
MAPQAAASEIVAIVHPSNPIAGLSSRELGRIYLIRKKSWADGSLIHILLPPAGSPASKELGLKVFGKGEQAIRAYYLKSIFRQRITTPPEQATSPSDAISAVAADPAAITLVSRAEVSGSSAIRVVPIEGF